VICVEGYQAFAGRTNERYRLCMAPQGL